MTLLQPVEGIEAPVVVGLSRRRLLRGVLALGFGAELTFLLLDATLNHARWVHSEPIQRLLNATREDGLPSWFGVTQTFCVGLTAGWATVVERARGASRRVVAGWAALTAIFVYLALDDGSALHERFGTWFDRAVLEAMPAWFPSYGWQVLFAPLFGSMGLFLLAFLGRQLVDGRARAALVGALGMLGTAVVMDFFEGLDEQAPYNVYGWLGARAPITRLARRWFRESGYDAVLHFSKALEECTEMAAFTVLWWVLLRHVTARAPQQRWSFD